MGSRLWGWIRFSRWPLAWRMGAIFWLIAFLPGLAVMAYWLYETEATQSEAQVAGSRAAGRPSSVDLAFLGQITHPGIAPPFRAEAAYAEKTMKQ